MTEEFTEALISMIKELSNSKAIESAKKAYNAEKTIIEKSEEIKSVVDECSADFCKCDGGLVISFNIMGEQKLTCVLGNREGVNKAFESMDKVIKKINKGEKHD